MEAILILISTSSKKDFIVAVLLGEREERLQEKRSDTALATLLRNRHSPRLSYLFRSLLES